MYTQFCEKEEKPLNMAQSPKNDQDFNEWVLISHPSSNSKQPSSATSAGKPPSSATYAGKPPSSAPSAGKPPSSTDGEKEPSSTAKEQEKSYTQEGKA